MNHDLLVALPDEIRHYLLDSLPLSLLACMPAVCKRWRALVVRLLIETLQRCPPPAATTDAQPTG